MPMQPGDVEDTSADTNRLEDWINFKPNTSIEKGVTEFVNWYKVFMDRNKSKMNYPSFENCTIAIVGLGYVGLPLAIEFSRTNYFLKSKIKLSRKVIGFDINKKRIDELKQNYDKTREVNEEEFKNLKNILFTND